MGHLTLAEETTPTTPAASKDVLFVDSSDHYVKALNSSGNVRTVENSVYRTVHESYFHIGSAISAGTFLPNTSSVKTGVDIGAVMFMSTYLNSADYGSGFKMRIRAQVAANATAPGTITLTFGLYTVTVAGGSSAFIPTLGTVVTGSTVPLANPSASAIAQGNSGDFAITAANFTDPSHYCIGLVTNATSATNGFLKGVAQLQVRNT